MNTEQPINEPQIAYFLKAFGRTSETFITNEIHLLESLGMKLQIFSVKKLERQKNHGVINRIRATINYLPQTSPFETTNFPVWLYFNLPGFAQSHLKLFSLKPKAWLLTLLECLVLSWKYRKGFFAWPRKVFIKEFLQAGYIAAAVVEAKNIRHLHAHFAHGSTTIAMFASRLSGVPFSFTAHAKDIYLAELNPGDLLAKKIAHARFVVTCTEANKTYLTARNRPNQTPIHTIYHGLDTSFFKPSFPRVVQTKPLILAVGRMVEKKGFTYLVEACGWLKSKGYDFDCQIIGGEDKNTPAIKEKIVQLQLTDTVTLQHAVTQEELTQIYQRGTVFALPCQIIDNGDRDGIPNVLVEAMAIGLPVVSTNISGIPELIESQHNGLLVEQKNAVALANAIAALLDDAALRARLTEAGRATVCRLFEARENTVALKNLFAQQLNLASVPVRIEAYKHETANSDEHLSQPV